MSRTFDPRDYGAAGDGVRLDTDSINTAILAAAAAGGGTVLLSRGRFLSFSIRLRSHVTLIIDEGAVLEAADPAFHAGRYDPPEDRTGELYQDFGHSHWHNSLIWGDGVDNVAIIGRGMIDGKGLTRDGPGARWRKDVGERPLSMSGMRPEEIAHLEPDESNMAGRGNKAIALKNSRAVTLRDLTIRKGGHMAVLATGVEDLLIHRLRIDTDRDGIDLDCVRRVRVTDCRVNSPNDDAIVLKSSYALGRPCSTEDVVISGCTVSGYDFGTMLDGRCGREQQLAPDRDRVTGRIKLGTESNGDFRRIRVDNCRFERCRGLAIETVDGGSIEDVSARGIMMEEVTTAPLFLRLGDRGRGPEPTKAGVIRGVIIENVEAHGIDHRFAATLAGLPDHPIEDVTLRRIRLVYDGGGTEEDSTRQPPELSHAYPEPSMFGPTPGWGLWVRHARGLRLDEVTLETLAPDARPPMRLDDVAGLTVRSVSAGQRG